MGRLRRVSNRGGWGMRNRERKTGEGAGSGTMLVDSDRKNISARGVPTHTMRLARDKNGKVGQRDADRAGVK